MRSWCIPTVSTRFIAKMEDVLEVYTRPYNPRFPLICLDEKGKELKAQTRPSLPILPHHPSAESPREDYEYERAGSVNLLVVCEPLRGWRRVVVGQDRGRLFFARELKRLVEEEYPQAEKIILVTDNLNIHGFWSLYDAFPPEEARRIAAKLEWHYTPEHGSWLNMAEIEISALDRQCLGRRFPDPEAVRAACGAWEKERNQKGIQIHWQFTAEDARIRLRRLYPVIEEVKT